MIESTVVITKHKTSHSVLSGHKQAKIESIAHSDQQYNFGWVQMNSLRTKNDTYDIPGNSYKG